MIPRRIARPLLRGHVLSSVGVRALPPRLIRSQTTTSSESVEPSNTPIHPSKTAAKRVENHKLRDITKQIQETISSGTGYHEIKDILEEGITFLREIRKQENIPEIALYNAFLPLSIELFQLAKQNGQDLNEVLQFLTSHQIAHQYHFTEVAISLLQNKPDPAQYHRVMQLWARYLEYKNSSPVFVGMSLKDGEAKYTGYHLPNLSYYAYVMACEGEGLTYSEENAKKFSNNDTVPAVYMLKRTLEEVKVFSKPEFAKLKRVLDEFRLGQVNPNSAKMLQKIYSLRDRRELDSIYAEIVQVSSKQGIKIDERVLVAMMDRYFYIDEYDDVFNMFQNILKSGIKPSIGAWNVVLRATINPNRFAKASAKQKREFMSNFKKMLATIEASKVAFDEETLGSIVSAFAIANDFDSAEQHIKQHPQLNGNAAKDGVLCGLVFNHRIDDAEHRMREYMKEGNYKPSATVLNMFMSHYAQKKNYKAVRGINEFMQEHGIPETVHSLTTLVGAYVNALIDKGKTPSFEGILHTLKGATKNEHTLSAVLNGLVDSGNMVAARVLYKHMMETKPRSSAIQSKMLQGELSHGDIPIAVQIFDYYISNINNDARIWNIMIKNLLTRDTPLALEYYRRMKNDPGVRPNRFTYYFILNYLLSKRNHKLISLVLADMAELPDADYVPEMVKMLSRVSKFVELPPAIAQKLSKHVNN
ncbi:uncharacterized protein LODBEIA_P57200 [Lodderomyces beijingensis]|uniref:Mitochondrial group I intron splicing factor CCM1 n=1 Tax=Lodderomyces beijingensis TaxID=1775926 RepID=A0ABP0ZFN3_9ASCO